MRGIGTRWAQVEPADPLEELVPAGLTAGDWIQAAVLVVAAALVAAALHRLVVRIVTAGTRSRVGVARLLGRLAGMVVFATGFVYALNSLGVRIAPLLGALGIAGIAVAFALQDILENFVAGIILQARDQFRLGDQIASGEWEGTVEDVNFRAVVLRTVEGTRVVLPSASVLKDAIHNLTAYPVRRTTVVVGVAYGTDLRHAVAVVRGAAREAPAVVPEPDVEVLVEALGESSVDLAVRFWHPAPIGSMWIARDQVLVAVYEALGDAGIAIPFPQRTLSFLEPLPLERDVAPPGADGSR